MQPANTTWSAINKGLRLLPGGIGWMILFAAALDAKGLYEWIQGLQERTDYLAVIGLGLIAYFVLVVVSKRLSQPDFGELSEWSVSIEPDGFHIFNDVPGTLYYSCDIYNLSATHSRILDFRLYLPLFEEKPVELETGNAAEVEKLTERDNQFTFDNRVGPAHSGTVQLTPNEHRNVTLLFVRKDGKVVNGMLGEAILSVWDVRSQQVRSFPMLNSYDALRRRTYEERIGFFPSIGKRLRKGARNAVRRAVGTVR